ncbi:MAG: hypothetical protein SPC25_01710 [Atopobiaceae bacterium]|nr:hypothetical protein [Atopobiaceae bacterium]
MEELSGVELSRRGFVVLAVSSASAFFIKPTLVEAMANEGTYLVSVKTVGYGYLWGEEDDWMLEDDVLGPDEAEQERESLEPGAILRFRQDPDIPRDEAWLEVVGNTGEELCNIPWSATPEEEAAVMRIVEKINAGHDVWAVVSAADHATIDAGQDNARIHELEFDVYYK